MIKQIQSLPPERVHTLGGLFPAALAQLLAVVLPEVDRRRKAARATRPHRHRAPGAGRKRRLNPAPEVLLVLLYLRHNVAHGGVGQMFGGSAAVSEDLFHELVPLWRDLCPATRFAAEKRWQRPAPPWQPDELDLVWIDPFETSVPRPTGEARQRRVYSGNKTRPTLKTQVAPDARGELLALDAGHRGPAADKRISEGSASATQFPTATKQGDLAYTGTAGVLTPQRKPRGGVLSDELRQENRRLASVRVHVEHGIRRLTAFRLMRENYRHGLGLFPMVAAAVVGLVHLARILQTG